MRRPKRKATKRKSTRSGPKIRSRQRSRKVLKERTYVRYDPETGERFEVIKRDWRYTEWSNRKPSAAAMARARGEPASMGKGTQLRKKKDTRPTAKQTADMVEAAANVAVTVAQSEAGSRAIGKAVEFGTKVAGPVGVGTAAVVGTQAAIAIGAGVASYFATTWLINHLPRFPTKQELDIQAVLAFRKARAETAKKLGRPLTVAEVQAMGKAFKQAIASNATLRDKLSHLRFGGK